MATFELSADVSSTQPGAIRSALSRLVDGTVSPTPNGFHVDGVVEGDDVESANRDLFYALRRIEQRTTLRAQWTHEGMVHRFVDATAQRTFAATSS